MRYLLLLLFASVVASCGSESSTPTTESVPEPELPTAFEELDWSSSVDLACQLGDSILTEVNRIAIGQRSTMSTGHLIPSVVEGKVVGFEAHLRSSTHAEELFKELTNWYNEKYSGNESDPIWNYWRFKCQDNEPGELMIIYHSDESSIEISSSQLSSI